MSDLALQLIAENKRTRATFLHLGNCGLTEVPAEVAELVWLEGLSFASEWFEWDGRDWKKRVSRNGGSGANLLDDIGPLGSLTALQALFISRTQVSDLAPLAALTGLRSLFVYNTQVGDLAPLAGLSALQALNVGGTQVTDLKPLAALCLLKTLSAWGTQITNLGSLAGLSALQMLYISNTQVADLAPLAGLSALHTLSVAGTRVTNLAPLAGLSALKKLHLHHTLVTELTPLASLSDLQTLDVSNTLVSDLAPLASLSDLQTLDISNTKVTDLSPLIELIRRDIPVKSSRDWWTASSANGISVRDCPLTNPPPEIVKQGNDAILNYFRERELGGVDRLYEAKMLILGEGRAGKTSLLTRLYQRGQPLPAESDTTRGIDISRQEFELKNGRPFRLNVWDFGGQQIYHATHQFFLTHRSLYVLVDDTSKDHKSVSDPGFKDWLELIEVFGGHSPTLIFQNEKGGRSKAIEIGGIRQRYDNVKEVYAGDLAQPDAADTMRDGIEFYASHLSHIGEEVPARWLQVRADIEQLAEKQSYVAVEQYFEIYGKHIEFDETKALQLSQYLHDLGVFLHFQKDPLLKRTVILQNEWATEAVFRVLDDETVKKKLGRFNQGDCTRLWKDSRYANMHLELLALMQKFELCYELRDSKPTTWLVPQLLPPEKPAELGDWGKPEDLVLRYKYDFMPKGMISRLTVRLHRFVRDPQMAWVKGVLFERDTTTVLAQILEKGDVVELRARGPEGKALLSVVAADLDALNDSFQGLMDKVDKRIPCTCEFCRAESVPWFFEHKALLRRRQHNVLTVQCERSFKEVPVLQLLDGIKLDKLPRWANESPSATSQAPVAASPRDIRIFLASSAELREDRDKFELYFRQHNDQLRKEGLYLKIVRWENSLDAISETRLQDEYNKAICDCDIFVSLFFTKTGKFTEEEFDVAHRQFKNSGKPRIFTFFKNAGITTGTAREDDLTSLWAFQKKLDKLEHFRTSYNNVEDLKLQFRDQLDKLLEQYD